MKKWHMEGIIEGASNRQRKLVVTSANQMYLSVAGYSEQKKLTMNLMREIKNYLERIFLQRKS